MAVSDEIVVIFILLLFVYFVIYKKNKLVGNVGFLVCGLGIASFSTGTIFAASGVAMVVMSIISIAYDLLWPVKQV